MALILQRDACNFGFEVSCATGSVSGVKSQPNTCRRALPLSH